MIKTVISFCNINQFYYSKDDMASTMCTCKCKIVIMVTTTLISKSSSSALFGIGCSTK